MVRYFCARAGRQTKKIKTNIPCVMGVPHIRKLNAFSRSPRPPARSGKSQKGLRPLGGFSCVKAHRRVMLCRLTRIRGEPNPEALPNSGRCRPVFITHRSRSRFLNPRMLSGSGGLREIGTCRFSLPRMKPKRLVTGDVSRAKHLNSIQSRARLFCNISRPPRSGGKEEKRTSAESMTQALH